MILRKRMWWSPVDPVIFSNLSFGDLRIPTGARLTELPTAGNRVWEGSVLAGTWGDCWTDPQWSVHLAPKTFYHFRPKGRDIAHTPASDLPKMTSFYFVSLEQPNIPALPRPFKTASKDIHYTKHRRVNYSGTKEASSVNAMQMSVCSRRSKMIQAQSFPSSGH